MSKVLFFTGAGISANAGIITYRDGTSSWTDSDLEAKSHSNRYGNHLDELWEKHWGPTEQTMTTALPTYTHHAIRRFQKDNEVIIATQNIDSLHEKAGSDNIFHLHGEMTPLCMRCKSRDVENWSSGGAPQCRVCKSFKTRTDIVLFGENLKHKSFSALESWAKNEADFLVSIGSSLKVFPAAHLVMDNTSKSIIINKDTTVFNKYAQLAYADDCDSVIDEAIDYIRSKSD